MDSTLRPGDGTARPPGRRPLCVWLRATRWRRTAGPGSASTGDVSVPRLLCCHSDAGSTATGRQAPRPRQLQQRWPRPLPSPRLLCGEVSTATSLPPSGAGGFGFAASCWVSGVCGCNVAMSGSRISRDGCPFQSTRLPRCQPRAVLSPRPRSDTRSRGARVLRFLSFSAILGPLHLHLNFRLSLSTSTK